MRFQCTFNLDPVLHEQHSFAIDNLRAWQANEKKRDDSEATAQKRRGMFNRDIYLSGLYLYQLSAGLPRAVSEQYIASKISAKRLAMQVSLFDDTKEDEALKANTENEGAILNDAQWEKLASLLAKHQQDIVKEQQDGLAAAREVQAQQIDQHAIVLQSHIQNDLKAGLQQEVVELLAQQLSQLQTQQQQTLAQLQQFIEQSTQKESEQLSETQSLVNQGVAASLDKHQQQLLAAISANQSSLMSAFKRLNSQVSNLNHGVNTAAGMQQESQALDTQLQRASKIKAKGLW